MGFSASTLIQLLKNKGEIIQAAVPVKDESLKQIILPSESPDKHNEPEYLTILLS